MNFTTPLYLYFLCVLFFLFILSRQIRILSGLSLWVLLLGSYFFYGAYSPYFLILILIPTVVDYFIGRQIYSVHEEKKKTFLYLSICLNLGILGIFKYAGFFSEILKDLGWISDNRLYLSIILPAGISFYTFQSMSYTIDIYRKKICPEKSIFRYALYLSFFPQLVAGPIVVARELLPQWDTLGEIRELPVSRILYLLLLGFTKKTIADRIAPIVDILYGNPGVFTAGDWALGVLSYSLQIYCDFSGYTDIARGSALIFGVDLPENFNLPYLSGSFSEFWKRWHISLSGWLREYLYVSMGGNREGVIRTFINLFITMLLGGLWHGASWNFLVWGAGHGTLLVLERIFQKAGFSGFPDTHTGSFLQKTAFLTQLSLQRLMIFMCITLLWVFFRSRDFSVSHIVFSRLFSLETGFLLGYSDRIFLLGNFFVVGLAHLIGFRYGDRISAVLERRMSWKLGFLFLFWIFLSVTLSRESRPFLYFVF